MNQDRGLCLIIGKPELSKQEIQILVDAPYRKIGVNRIHLNRYISGGDMDDIVFHDDWQYERVLRQALLHQTIVTQKYVDTQQRKINQTHNMHFFYTKSDAPAQGVNNHLYFNIDSMTVAIDYACYLGFKQALLVISNERGSEADRIKLKEAVNEFKPFIDLFKYREDAFFELPVKSLESLESSPEVII